MKNPFSKTKIDEYADKDVQELVKRVIRDDLSGVVAEVVKAEMKPLQGIVEQMQGTQNTIVRQVNEDRKDIGDLKTGQATMVAQQKVIIANQNHSEEQQVEAIKQEVRKIPKHIKGAVENEFEKKPFLAKIKEKFLRKEANKQ